MPCSGPFKLGRWAQPLAVVSCVWVAFITVAVCIPSYGTHMLNRLNFNYAPVMLVALVAFAMLIW